VTFLRARRITPEQLPPPRVTTLEFIEASLVPDMSGWFVYALCQRADGHVFYAGQTDHWYSRIRDHSYQFKEEFDPAGIWHRPCVDQAEADLYELLLIRRYDPERNTAGRREELEARMRGHTRGGFTAGHKYSTREFLDSRQEQD
jgi:hypothetical protein